MPRFMRPLIAGVAAAGLLLGAAPVVAEEALPAPDVAVNPDVAADSGDSGEAVDSVDLGLTDEVAVPVEVEDVTQTDDNLRSTRNEVTVLVDDGAGSPTVTKLRTDSPADAEELADALAEEPGVVAARTSRLRAFVAVNAEPLAPSQWNLPLVGVPAAWDVTQGAGVTVAVIDTGVDGTHPDLVGHVLPEIDLLPEVQPLPEQNGHGTRVASIIAAAVNNIGIAGVAPQASILPVSALDPLGYGDSSTVATAIIAATDAGARVINLSLGGPDRDPVLDAACAYAFAKGAVIVAAGGNSYLAGNRVQYPAASPNVLAVASVNSTGTPSGFSNTGPHIDLAAPGEGILGAIPGAAYDLESGTSFAAPHVAATVALVMAANPQLSSAEVASLVQLTAADDLSGNGRDDQLGYGIVRADRAVQAALIMTASGLPSDAKLKLRRLNAKPEPARRGKVSTFTTQVKARFPDGSWRADPIPALVQFEFKRAGNRKYRPVAVVASGVDGYATLEAVPFTSGRWRARVQLPSGHWKKSRPDFLRVRR